MKLGIVAFASDTGLGYQTYNLYKHLSPAKTLAIDLSEFNGLEIHKDWYPDALWAKGIPDERIIDKFLDGLDVVFNCETPLNFYILREANRRGIKTICQINFEFADWLRQPYLPKPDVFALPSLWNIKRLDPRIFANLIPLPVPTDSDAMPKRQITEAKHFFHVAGRPAVLDRNGTYDFIRVANYLNIDAKFTVYCQNPSTELKRRLGKVRLIEHLDNYSDLYKDGDVLVMPRKYGGLCLPVNEAITSGIPVIMPDIDPNNRWLPKDWLVGAKKRPEPLLTRTTIDVYDTELKALADKLLFWNENPAWVQQQADIAKSIAKTITWDALKPKYISLMESLCI